MTSYCKEEQVRGRHIRPEFQSSIIAPVFCSLLFIDGFLLHEERTHGEHVKTVESRSMARLLAHAVILSI